MSLKPIAALTFACLFGMLQPSHAAVSLAGGVHTEDFEVLPSQGWTFSHWGVAAIPTSGYSANMTNGGSNHGTIATPSGGTTYQIPDEGVAPIKTPGSFLNYGFSGNWLTNTTSTEGVRTARVEFDNLGVHTSINLSFLIGMGDSIDSGEGTLELAIDGQVVFRREASGSAFKGTPSLVDYPNVGASSLLTTHATSANLNNYYREQWFANPTTENSRSAQSWTLDGAYGFNGEFAHTADTLTLEWRIIKLNSTFTDEFLAIDNLRVQVVPEPQMAILSMMALGGLAWRRRR